MNRRPPACKADALPLSYAPENFCESKNSSPEQPFVICRLRGTNLVTAVLSLATESQNNCRSGPNFALRNLVGPSGLEPLTPVLSGLCSNQLSYGPEITCNVPACLPAGRQCVMCNALIHYTFTSHFTQ